MFKFLRSRHRKLYCELARKYHVWPEKVYKLAHGKHSRNSKDTSILHDLLAHGVIHRHTGDSSGPEERKVTFAK